jgi:phosphoglycolate phosphatase
MQAILFDLDGTLIDSLEDLADAVNAMLSEHGFPTQPLALFPQYIGDGVGKLVERALPEGARTPENIQMCMADYQRHYEATWDQKTKPYPGMVETVQTLRARGIKTAVLSNKPDRFTQMCCERFFPAGCFDKVLGARDHVPRKPDPMAALEIADALGVPASASAYVGDSGLDMEMARNAGMLPVGALWGFRGEQELRAHGAMKLVARAEELLGLV